MMETMVLLPGARTQDGRSIAALRGNVRDRLDYEVCLNHEVFGYGIGRSAFIAAAIDLALSLDDLDLPFEDENGESLRDRFLRVAGEYERSLPR